MRHLYPKTPTVRHGVDATVRRYQQADAFKGVNPTYYICEYICCTNPVFDYLYNTPDINIP